MPNKPKTIRETCDEAEDDFEPELLEVDNTWSLDRLNEYRKYLQETLLRLTEEAGNIRNQLATAQQHAWQTGEYADRGWYRRASDALVYRKRQLQAVQLAMGTVGRLLKRAQHAEDEREQETSFIRAAKRILSNEQFQEIMKASRYE